MAKPDDDDSDALTWAGDEERGVASTRPSRGARGTRGGSAGDAAALGADSARTVAHATDGRAIESLDRPAAPPLTAGQRILFAAGAVLYLALTVTWVLGARHYGAGTTDVLEQLDWQFAQFLAMVSPVLWFVAVFAITRVERIGVSVAWLVLGLVVLAPLPFLFGLVLTAQ